MKPTITISDSRERGPQLNIQLDDILSALSNDQRLELIRMVAMDDVIVQDIVDQLATGYTHDVSSLGDSFLNECRIKLMPMMGEVAAQAIRQLVQERDNAKLDARRHNDWAWKLFHAWPRDADRRNMPAIPDFGHAYKMPMEDARAIAGVEAPEEVKP